MSHRYQTASLAFEETLERLDLQGDELRTDEAQEHLGRRAALLAAADVAWTTQLGPLYAWQDVAALLRSVGTRQGVHDLARRRRLLGLPAKSGQILYPAFQFKGGKPIDGLHEILDVFAEAPLSSWSVASWLTTPQDELAGDTPLGHLAGNGARDEVLLAAKRTAARVAA